MYVNAPFPARGRFVRIALDADRPPIGLKPEERAEWKCEANFITCLNHHLLRYVDSQFIVDQRRIDGHIYYGCRKCDPPTFFFAHVSSRPSPIANCVAISQDQFRYWHDSQADPLSTTEMLNRLGYNDRWRQPRV